MNVLVFISRLLTGVVFIFSGFVKAVDPVGSQIKFEDYLTAMGLDALMPYALAMAVLLNAAEIIIGILLVFNAFPKFASYGALLLMLVFTPLTLWLAVANPVSDCGCFGDAVKLTNWQTFWKNIIIDAFLLILFFNRKRLKSASSRGMQIGLSFFAVLLSFGFQSYNLQNLPLIDFRPYKKGANISEQMKIPEDAPKDEYETTLYYINKKSGERKAFTMENAPYEDSLKWEYDTTINILVKEGYEPPIHDFRITKTDGTDITSFVLEDKNPVFVLVSADLSKGNFEQKEALSRISEFAKSKNKGFVCFTGSGREDMEKYSEKLPEGLNFFNADKKVLKTMIRSNPGLILLKGGTIVDKWHYRNLPDSNELEKLDIKKTDYNK